MNRITEGVGKKIVDALKQQSDIEIQNVVENTVEDEFDAPLEFDIPQEESIEEQTFQSETFTTPVAFSTPVIEQENFAPDLDDFEMPTNIAVLKQLINQLPAGVSKQTGAQIIKQTMEALGISMKTVLQEAQAAQENLNHSARECQASIMEYKKQINSLERQAQKLQKQATSLNDIISLFVQTNI